jgi:predicted transcriptional regulator with HTH domain
VGTGTSREYLDSVLSNRNKPDPDNLRGILSGLGFRTKLEPRERRFPSA